METIVVSAPGPGSFAYLPIDLIPKIGLDRQEGAQVRILYTGGSPVSLEQLSNHNVEFAIAGAPAAMSLRTHGGDVVLIAAITKVAPFSLLVRIDLQDQIKSVADLKGRTIGVHSGTPHSENVSQQVLELLLASEGITPDMVKIVSVKQSWKIQYLSIFSGEVDALMGTEPFSSRLLSEKRIFFLVSFEDPKIAQKIKGAGFLYASLATQNWILAESPKKVAKMVKILKNSLAWIASHTPEQIVAALGISDPGESSSLLLALKKYPNAFVQDASFSTAQIQETNTFFHAGFDKKSSENHLLLENMIDDRWVGTRP
ncbi:NMT1 domain-containing protein [Gammaproteobacteria bacterium]